MPLVVLNGLLAARDKPSVSYRKNACRRPETNFNLLRVGRLSRGVSDIRSVLRPERPGLLRRPLIDESRPRSHPSFLLSDVHLRLVYRVALTFTNTTQFLISSLR